MPRRAPYLGPARRREPVLDAALEVFAEGGFAATSMSAIAQAAGVSKAVLYDCFPGGKEELYFALLNRGEEHFTQYLADSFAAIQGRPFAESLRAGLVAFLEYAEVNPRAFRVIFGAAGTADPHVSARVGAVRGRIVDTMVARTLDHLGLDTEYATLVELYIRAIVAVSETLARWSLEGPTLDRDTMADLTVQWFMRGFDGLGFR